MASYALAPDPSTVEPDPPPPADPISASLAEQIRDHIWMGAATSPRSLQQSIGASEIGGGCERQIAYRVVGTPPCNFPDPLRALVGTGMHLALAELYARLDAGVGRFVLESPVSYRNLPGTVDHIDRRRKVAIDWKTSTKRKIGELRRNGPPKNSVVQVKTYAAALLAAGEPIERIALAYIPLDGELSDIWVWSAPLDPAEVDQCIDRYERIAASANAAGPDSLPATPTRLCPWCSHYRPGSTDSTTGCPGLEPTKKGSS